MVTRFTLFMLMCVGTSVFADRTSRISPRDAGLTTSSRSSDYGHGLRGGRDCPYETKRGRGADDPRDTLDNYENRIKRVESRMERFEKRREAIEERLNRSRERIQEALTKEGFAVIEEHYTHERDRSAYRKCTVAPMIAPLPSNKDSSRVGEAILPGDELDDGGDSSASIPTPQRFCVTHQGKRCNAWRRFAENNGRVHPSICRYYVPGVHRNREIDGDSRRACSDGLEDYYRNQKELRALNREIRRAERERDNWNRRLELAQDRFEDDKWNEENEGGICAECEGDYYEDALREAMMDQGEIFDGMGPRRVLGPAIAGPAACTPVPGLMNVVDGQYGCLPSGASEGAFGCGGQDGRAYIDPRFRSTDPLFGNPFLQQMRGPAVLGLPGQNYTNSIWTDNLGALDPMIQGGGPRRLQPGPLIAGPATTGYPWANGSGMENQLGAFRQNLQSVMFRPGPMTLPAYNLGTSIPNSNGAPNFVNPGQDPGTNMPSPQNPPPLGR